MTRRLDRGSSLSIGIQGIAVVRAVVQGRRGEGARLMRGFERVSASETDSEHWYLLAEVYGLLGEAESCARLLGKAVDGGFFNHPAMLANPFLETVRDRPEVQQVLARARHKHEAMRPIISAVP